MGWCPFLGPCLDGTGVDGLTSGIASRRVGRACQGPWGEMFDHGCVLTQLHLMRWFTRSLGCDALNTTVECISGVASS